MCTDHHTILSILRAGSPTSPSPHALPPPSIGTSSPAHEDYIKCQVQVKLLWKERQNQLTGSQHLEKHKGKRPPRNTVTCKGVGGEHEPAASHTCTLGWWGESAHKNGVSHRWPFFLTWPSAHWCFNCLFHTASQRCFRHSLNNHHTNTLS